MGTFSWFFFFKQKTAYEMRISDWSSDVCSSDLARTRRDAAFIGALDAFSDRNPSPVRFYATREAGAGRPDIAAIVAAAGPGTHVYCCGPLPMLKDFEAAAPADAADRKSTRLNSSH